MNQETTETGKCNVLGNTKKGHPRIKMEMKLYRDRDREIYIRQDLLTCLMRIKNVSKVSNLTSNQKHSATVRLRLPYHQMLTHYQLKHKAGFPELYRAICTSTVWEFGLVSYSVVAGSIFHLVSLLEAYWCLSLNFRLCSYCLITCNS